MFTTLRFLLEFSAGIKWYVLQNGSELDKGDCNAMQYNQDDGHRRDDNSGADGFQKTTAHKHPCWTVQFAATGGFAGARVELEDPVQNGSEHCVLPFTRLMAHFGTVPTKKDWF